MDTALKFFLGAVLFGDGAFGALLGAPLAVAPNQIVLLALHF